MDYFCVTKYEQIDSSTLMVITTGDIEYTFEITKEYKKQLDKIIRHYGFITNRSFYETLEEYCGLIHKPSI